MILGVYHCVMRTGFIIFVLSLTLSDSTSAPQVEKSGANQAVLEPVRVKTSWLFGDTYLIYTRPNTRQKLSVDPLADLTPSQLAILEKLNRVTANRLERQKTLVVPEAWSDDELTYSPFPKRYDWAADQYACRLIQSQVALAWPSQLGRSGVVFGVVLQLRSVARDCLSQVLVARARRQPWMRADARTRRLLAV